MIGKSGTWHHSPSRAVVTRPAIAANLGILCLVATFVVNAFVWSLVIPYNRAPDEHWHMVEVEFIAREHRLPVFGKNEDAYLIVTPQGQPIDPYALHPALSYLAGATLAASLPVETFRAARLFSLFTAAALVLVAFLVGREIFRGDDAMALAIAGVIAFVPQFTFVAAYVNTDALAALASGATLLLSVRGMARGWTVGLCLALGVALGLVLLSKYNAYFALLFAAYAVALSLRGVWSTVGKALLAIAVPAVAVSGWWFLRNIAIYGEPVPNAVLAAAIRQEAPNWVMGYAGRGYNVISLSLGTPWWEWTFKSFWGMFDYMRLPLDRWHYVALLVFTFVCATGLMIGLAVRLRARSISLRDWRAQVLLFFGVLIVAQVLSSLFASLYKDFQAQGRYVFPALIPIATYLVLGASQIVRTRPRRNVVLIAVVAGLALLNLHSLLGYLVPAYVTR